MKVLDSTNIQNKIKRLAIEILENNYSEKQIVLVGINNNGLHFAKLLHKEMQGYEKITSTVTNLRIDPANPVKSPVTMDSDIQQLKNKVIIVVDDVANTGRTVFYAFKAFMEVLPKKIEVAVLVDRKHKSFPVLVDYCGISLNTTLQDHIKVDLKTRAKQVVLE